MSKYIVLKYWHCSLVYSEACQSRLKFTLQFALCMNFISNGISPKSHYLQHVSAFPGCRIPFLQHKIRSLVPSPYSHLSHISSSSHLPHHFDNLSDLLKFIPTTQEFTTAASTSFAKISQRFQKSGFQGLPLHRFHILCEIFDVVFWALSIDDSRISKFCKPIQVILWTPALQISPFC